MFRDGGEIEYDSLLGELYVWGFGGLEPEGGGGVAGLADSWKVCLRFL